MKIWVNATYLVTWNAGFLIALYLAEWNPHRVFQKEGAEIISITLIGASAFHFLVLTSNPIRSLVLHPRKKDKFNPKNFMVSGLIILGLAISILVISTKQESEPVAAGNVANAPSPERGVSGSK